MQSHGGLKVFFASVSYITDFYLHSYFCFRKHTNSNEGFTCGFDISPITTATTVVEVLHQPYLPKVIAVPGIATTAEVVAVTSVLKVLQVLPVLTVLDVTAQPPVQHNLHGNFQHQIPNCNSQIWIAMSKPGVFKKDSPQHQILYQNSGQGYIALFRIISHHHPVTDKHPHLLICSTPVQLTFETNTQYFQHYNIYINLPAFLEEN